VHQFVDKGALEIEPSPIAMQVDGDGVLARHELAKVRPPAATASAETRKA
jgi:hypothetical protein